MGGAFTAIADDSTAAIANPAGLGLLSTIEAGVSGKRFDDSIGLVTAKSTAIGNGFLVPYPPVKSINSEISSSDSAFEFAGVVVPVSRRFVLAVSWVQNLRFEGDLGDQGYPYIELRDNRTGGLTRRDYLYEYREFGKAQLRNRAAVLSAALRLTERVRIGAGVSWNHPEFTFLPDASGPHRIVNTTYLSPTKIDVKTTKLQIEEFDDRPIGFVLGLQADLLPENRLTAGLSYRYTGPAHGILVMSGHIPDALAGQERREFTFSVPADLAAGVALQPVPGLTLAIEGQWVFNSQMYREELPVESYDGAVGPPPGFPVSGVLARLERPPDAVIPRAGLEYVASLNDFVLAFRIGYHRQPSQGVRADLTVSDAEGVPYDITDPPFSESVRTIYSGGRADDRFSAGVGATIKRALSVDFAFDIGRTSRRLALSAFYRF